MDALSAVRIASVLRGHLGLGTMSDARDVSDDLVRRYGEPHRRYHTAEHVGEVLAEVERLCSWGRPERPAVEVAAWFHDAIYDVAAPRGEAEAASADLATNTLVALGAEQEGPLVVEVDRLIRLTVGHVVEPHDAAGAVLVDADLWILSSPTERYDRYATDVRAEYAHLPDDVWAVGRGSVLQRFLDNIDELYRAGTREDQAARRRRAAGNMNRELAALSH